MLTFKSDQLHGLVKKRVPQDQFSSVDSLAFLEFPDVDESIKDDVAFLKNHPLILKETVISGYSFKGSSLFGGRRKREAVLMVFGLTGRDRRARQGRLGAQYHFSSLLANIIFALLYSSP